ncbi:MULTISPECIES: spore coat protein CotJB [unclassified Psychrobacillus]|uniref:spore coat protein CotJB n=1 Tax=unclassified Psychrobacillus TaxID=2636677 RepID=UPI00146C7953|nr:MULTISPECIES: spore coat protein CotJB [unclassified Psychrobacillus]MCM3357919.1 spore coat protein CotJB [Psychrobacillus sp. MER TA 171]NME05291.1 spore coat protein CotJB [Psychrobacillus sp. BL-248-WT-3]
MTSSDHQWNLLKQVQQMDFVVVELTLYTDTHPDDLDALEQWRMAIKNAAAVRKKYEAQYGPLSLMTTPSKQALDVGWRWNSTPWPWQI